MSNRFLAGLLPISLLLFLAACSSPPVAEDPAAQERLKAKIAKKLRPDQPHERQDFFLERRLPHGQEVLPMHAWFEAERQMRSMPRHTPRMAVSNLRSQGTQSHDANAWEWLGPGNIAGRMRSLVFHPDEWGVLFAAGVSGGIWKSENDGQSWIPLSDDAVNLNIGVLAIDSENPDILYAGTGELFRNTGRRWSPMTGAGILKSLDGGETWNRLIATDSRDFLYVSDIVLSPHDSDRLYAATNSGVWRSDDGGVTFEQTLRPANEQGILEYEGCNDLLIRSDRNTDWVLAACASRSTDDRYWLPNTVTPEACDGPCPAAIFLNTDAAGEGAWEKVLSEAGQGRTEMAAFAGDERIIYASSASIVPGFDRTGDGKGDYDNGLHAVFRSNDGGRTWRARLRNDDPDALSTYLFSYADGFDPGLCGWDWDPFIYGAGWYNQAIAVDPLDPDIVWVGGMDIYRSDDGARTFGMASHWWLQHWHGEYVHADQHLFRFHPSYNGVQNHRLYVTNDGGIAYTDNARAAVDTGEKAPCDGPRGRTNWRELNADLGTTQFYDGAAWPDGERYLGGTQDNGTLLGDDARGAGDWDHIFGGDGGVVAIHPNDPDTFYVSSQNGNIARTRDGGATFEPADNRLHDASIFIMPYVMDPNRPSRLWAGGTRLWRTDDEGDSWQQASGPMGGFTFDSRISALAVAPGNSNHILVGNRKGIYYSEQALSSDGLTNWQSTSPRYGWVSALAFNPENTRIAYATYSTFGGVHVWKTTDGGRSWQPLDGSGAGKLPDVPVHDIALNPDNPEQIYIGTDLGLFVSLDGGRNWAVENTGFANVITESLYVTEPRNGPPMLFAFTYGRGVWRVPLSDLEGKADHRIGPGDSGPWYDPAQSGHGLFVEVIEQDGIPRLLASWYVYLDGEQVWLTGVGSVEADTARVELFITTGGDFPPHFDPASVTAQSWGELRIEFESDRTARAEWNTDYPGFGDGSMDLLPLARPLDVHQDPEGAQISACHSGSWYNAEQGGHGFQLQVISIDGKRHLTTVWYAYLDGKQIYLVGTGPIEDDRAEVTYFMTEGGDFPPDFDPALVSKQSWGTAEFTFQGPESGTVRWEADLDGFSDGELSLTRLTRQLGRGCGP